MFERFTDRARHVIVLAQQRARGLEHNYIGTEHLLLGLLAETEGMAAQALESLGVTSDETRRLVIAEVGQGKKPPLGHIPFTPRAKNTLEGALREALSLQHNYIGTEHLLLGLLRVDEGLGARLLQMQGVDDETVRQVVLDLLRRAPAAGQFQGPPTPGDRPVTGPGEMRTTKATEESLKKARRYAGVEAVGSHHLLLAALSDPTSAATRALGGLGVDLNIARQALLNVDVTGTTDELPEQAGRRLMRLRLTDDTLTLESTDPALVGLVRTTLEALGQPTDGTGIIPGDLDAAVSLATVWQELNLSLKDIHRRATRPRLVADPDPADPDGPDPDGDAA